MRDWQKIVMLVLLIGLFVGDDWYMALAPIPLWASHE